MTGRTNTGGQGAGPLKKSTIVVSYSSGATCTVTNGSKTYTAPDTSGSVAFMVDAGTWTVKAGDRSQTVTVTSTRQNFIVNLATVVLIAAGSGFASGMSMTGTGTATTNSAKAIEVKGVDNANAYLYFPSIDVTNYSTMKVRVKGTYYCSYGLGTTSALTYSVKGVQNYVEETLSLDISDVKGTYRPAVYVGLYSSEICTTIYEWWLE